MISFDSKISRSTKQVSQLHSLILWLVRWVLDLQHDLLETCSQEKRGRSSESVVGV